MLARVPPVCVGSDYWLSYWSSANTTYIDAAGATVWIEPQPVGFYIGIYAAFGAATALLFLLRNIVTTLSALRASRNIHQQLIDSVLRAPMSFMDKTPTGRLLNRFTKDTDTMDVELPMLTAQYTTVIFTTLGSLVLVATVTPYFLIPIAAMSVVYYFVQRYYQHTSRELKRLQSIARSPIFVHFQETLAGTSGYGCLFACLLACGSLVDSEKGGAARDLSLRDGNGYSLTRLSVPLCG